MGIMPYRATVDSFSSGAPNICHVERCAAGTGTNPAVCAELMPVVRQQAFAAGGRIAVPDGSAAFVAVGALRMDWILDDGRLHLSVQGPSTSIRGTPDVASADKRIADLFPQLGPLEWERSWTGWVGVNLAQEPRLSQLDEGLFGVAGYSGRGLAYGTLMGAEVARRMIDPQHPEAVFPVRPVLPLPGHRFAPAVARQVLNLYSFLDDRELRVRRHAARARGPLS